MLDVASETKGRMFMTPLFVAVALLVAAPPEPQVVGTFPENEADVVRLPDGTLKIFYNERGHFVGSLTSTDDGRTWSEPRKEFDVAGDTAHAMQVLLDRHGELQVFYLVITRNGRKLGVDYFLDLWCCKSLEGRTKWAEPKMCYHGAVGALRGLVQTRSGRIIVPFSTAHPERVAGPPIGYFYTTAVYSDDDGETWHLSPSQLTAPCYDGYNGGNYGAVEPTIVELNDGRLWMLIRTQTGRMYESFSQDGTEWSAAEPSRFYASNSPAMFRRLDDGRLLVMWNNAQVGPRHEGQGVYSGRDAIHAALSDDDGKTWRGFREVYRDPTRHAHSDVRNDRGTAYPDAVQTRDGAIVVVTGQAADRRAIVRFTVDWLLAKHRDDDFSTGLDGWHAFQEIGPAQRFFRERRLGAQLVANPDDSSKRVLSVGRRDDEPGAGAVWNFPAGRKGKLTLDVRISPDFGGATLSLTDRLFQSWDDAIPRNALFSLPLTSGDGLKPDRIHTLRFHWDVAKKECTVTLDDAEFRKLPLNDVAETFGVSYLCVRSTAEKIDTTGLMVEHVAVDVEP